ncbi:acetyl-CoA carboxylase [Ceratobasidium sp. AG-Ba]|nr:acetyl-CoA carboxylase [Ceratobasidium sp. AG-Ba]
MTGNVVFSGHNVAALVLSHSKAQSKNKLFLTLLGEIQRGAPGPAISGVEESLNEVLRGIAVLESRSATQVALMAREVLICTQQPSYEEQSSRMEQLLTTSLMDSKLIAYGMLPGFFAHKDCWVLVASMDVYVRRAYRAYNLISVGYEGGGNLDDGDAPNIVMWRFKLGLSSSPPPTPCFNSGINTPKRAGSVGDLTHIVNSRKLIHTGSIATSPNCDALLNGYEKVAEQLPHFNTDKYSCRHEAGAELPNALYFARHVCAPSDDMEDNEWREKLIALVNSGASILKERGMRRVSFLVCRSTQYPFYLPMSGTGGSGAKKRRSVTLSLPWWINSSSVVSPTPNSHYNLSSYLSLRVEVSVLGG